MSEVDRLKDIPYLIGKAAGRRSIGGILEESDFVDNMLVTFPGESTKVLQGFRDGRKEKEQDEKTKVS